jgi:DNA-binding GntR family transcriptional regulator
MMRVDPKIRKTSHTLRSEVTKKLRDAIVSGHFIAGERLVERELCKLLGVGRTSVREALRELEADDLVRFIPNRGPVVNGLNRQEIRQLYAFRALLEGYAGRKSAECDSATVKRKIVQASVEFAAAASAGSESDVINAKGRFYQALMSSANNPYVVKKLVAMSDLIAMMQISSLDAPNRLTESVEEIAAISDAIQRADVKAAELACRRHVENAWKATLKNSFAGRVDS